MKRKTLLNLLLIKISSLSVYFARDAKRKDTNVAPY
jgi:hypothetical protein